MTIVDQLKALTREQWKEIDEARALVMQPTVQEVKAREDAMFQGLVQRVQSYLTPYGITLTGKEKGKEVADLRKLYILGDGTEKNKPMNERLGNDERLKDIVKDKQENSPTITDFLNFVYQYEA